MKKKKKKKRLCHLVGMSDKQPHDAEELQGKKATKPKYR